MRRRADYMGDASQRIRLQGGGQAELPGRSEAAVGAIGADCGGVSGYGEPANSR